VADIQRDHVDGAAAEQHVGEAPGRGADVEAVAAYDIDREGVQGVRELEPAAADVRMVGDGEDDLIVWRDGGTGFRDWTAVDADLSGENQCSSPLPRGRQSAFDDQLIETKTR
jgi:hypothetical protein